MPPGNLFNYITIEVFNWFSKAKKESVYFHSGYSFVFVTSVLGKNSQNHRAAIITRLYGEFIKKKKKRCHGYCESMNLLIEIFFIS